MSECIGPYAIERELGSGGMGRVYAARVAESAPGFVVGETVALKVVHPHLLEAPGFLARFLREADLGATVRHPNVVRTLGCEHASGTDGAQYFMVMEYVQGQTLAELQAELERVPEELCRHVAREICRGLAAIHTAGIVHRDIKPDNVLITPDHEVKLMDLGVALLTGEAIRLSQTGAFVGSVEYAAPEQFRGDDVDARTDLYALGVLLYEIAAGAHPHRGGGFHDVLRRVIEEEPRPLGEANPQLSPFFEEVVHTLLVKDPRGRFASAAQLLGVLEEGEESRWWRDRALEREAATRRPLRRIRIPRETAVYGRERELSVLRGLYAKARAGIGQVVLIEGEAGIGKSRLVDELVGSLHADGEDINFLFGSYPPNGAATASGAFSSAYNEHFGEAGSAEFLARTPALVPAFDALLRGELAPEGVERLTRDSLPTCFVNATRALAAERVTVVFIDDLHFAPDEGRALFTSLAMAAPGHRILLIGAARPALHGGWQGDLDRYDFVTRLVPERLSAKDLVRLLEDSFKSKALAESVGLQIIVKSDGNPFFAFEIVRGLREGQFIEQSEDGSWVGTRVIEEIRIPSSVLDLVNARVSDLTEEERDVLDVASCWGYEFDPVLVGDVVGMARIPLLKLFSRVERKHGLVRASGRQYVFDHHQVQEALYSALHEQLREEYHAELAGAFEERHDAAAADPTSLRGDVCVPLCEHLLRGARGRRALRYLPAAQHHLEERYLQAQLVTLTERALAMPNLLAGEERVETLLSIAHADGPLALLGRGNRQREAAEEARALAAEIANDLALARSEHALGSALALLAEYAEAERAYRRSLERATSVGDPDWTFAAAVSLGIARWAQGDLDDAQQRFDEALEISRRTGSRFGEASIIGNVGGLLRARGRFQEAARAHEQHLQLTRELGHRLSEAGALVNLGIVRLAEGLLTEARERLESALEIYAEIGDRRGVGVAVGNLGTVLHSEGRIAEARAQFERSLAISREIGDRDAETRATGNLGSTLWALGRVQEAQELYEQYLNLSREIGSTGSATVALHNLGAVLRDRGDLEGAERSLCECLALAEDRGDAYLVAATLVSLGSLRADLGRDDAVATLERALAAAAEQGFVVEEAVALAELACLDARHVDAALASCAASAERMDADSRRETAYLLWRATGDRVQLESARRLVDAAVAQVDEATRLSMLTNLRVYREIMADCAAAADAEVSEGGDDGPASPPRDESPTRVQ